MRLYQRKRSRRAVSRVITANLRVAARYEFPADSRLRAVAWLDLYLRQQRRDVDFDAGDRRIKCLFKWLVLIGDDLRRLLAVSGSSHTADQHHGNNYRDQIAETHA